MAGFGDELRFERERRGVSLGTLCAETKVNTRHLEALEHSDYHALPGGIFRRGIVRAYIAALGLDEQLWMPRFEQSLAEAARSAPQTPVAEGEAWAAFAANVKKNRGPQGAGKQAQWMGVLAVSLSLGGGTWVVWHYVLRSRVHH